MSSQLIKSSLQHKNNRYFESIPFVKNVAQKLVYFFGKNFMRKKITEKTAAQKSDAIF